MRKIYSVLVIVFLLFSCDDGDIITTELEFEDTFENCGELVFFKTKTDPNESLSLYIDTSTTIADLLATQENPDNALLVELVNETETFSSESMVFNYRTYNNDPTDLNLFCSDIALSTISIIQDYSTSDITTEFIMSLEEDDNDGIPAELEDDNDDGDNDHTTNPRDTDGDGLPDYLDDDDDGDNVKTSVENPNYTITDGLANAQDTDGDGIDDYLDDDDDNDTVLTRDEENDTQDQNPTNDITNNASGIGADYLNAAISTTVPATAFRTHTVAQTFEVRLFIYNLNLAILTLDILDFGNLDNSSTTTTRTVTPGF